MSFFRRDEFVRSVQGQSVPGAQVFVCTQPANVASYPPTPLATIYSDAAGTVPITQPMITDGFGHCDFYVGVGTYTIVVANNSVIQQIYTDQLIGQTGAGSISLQSNSIANTDQAVLNLKNGSFITITPDGAGGVVVDTTSPIGTVLTLQTNGSTNTDQALLNLESTDNTVTLAADGSGNVNLSAPPSGIGATIPFINYNCGYSQTGVVTGALGANLVAIMAILLPYKVTFTHFNWYSPTGDDGSSLSDIGIYSISGPTAVTATRVCHIGPTTGIASTSVNSVAVQEGTVTLSAGMYLFAMTNSTGGGFEIYFSEPAQLMYSWSTTATVPGPSAGTLPSSFTIVPLGLLWGPSGSGGQMYWGFPAMGLS
jgi:hypothetical protein